MSEVSGLSAGRRRISKQVRKNLLPSVSRVLSVPFSRAPFSTAAVCDIMVCYKSLHTTAGWSAGRFISPASFQHCTSKYFGALKTSKCLEIWNIELVDEETSVTFFQAALPVWYSPRYSSSILCEPELLVNSKLLLQWETEGNVELKEHISSRHVAFFLFVFYSSECVW